MRRCAAIAAFGCALLAWSFESGAQGAARPVPLPTLAADPAVSQARQLLRGELAKLPADHVHRIGAAFVDLDGVGSPELVVQIEGPDTCGSAGCETVVFRGDGVRWAPVLRTVAGSIAVYPRRQEQPLGSPVDLLLSSTDIWRWTPAGRYALAGRAL